MNVGELRRALAKYNDDAEIHLYFNGPEFVADNVVQIPTGVKESGGVVLLGCNSYLGIVKDIKWDIGDESEEDFKAANLPNKVYIPMDMIFEDDDELISCISDIYNWLISDCTIERWDK